MNTIELLQQLVKFDTTSRLSNLELIRFVQAYLASYGIDSILAENAAGDKANLYATIGPKGIGGIMLAGHTDVVPVDGQPWTSAPFTLTCREGKWYGRGAADMKGFIAAVLAAVPKLASTPLRLPVHIALTYDEEIGCIGVRRLLEVLGGLPVLPAMCVVGEPTRMQLVAEHKGKAAFRVQVTGLEGHSSNPARGVNAVQYAARLVSLIDQLAKEKQQMGPFDPLYEVPYTTLHTGTMQGGTALNIIPALCAFDFEIRYLPGDSPAPLIARIRALAATLEEEMRQVSPAAGITFTERSTYPGLCTGPDAEVVRFVRQLLDHDQPLGKIAFGTEGGLYATQLSIPTVVCGPGSIDQAHQPDEWIEESELDRCDHMMQRLLEVLSSETNP